MKINNFQEENYTKEEISLNFTWAVFFTFFILFAAVLLFGIPFYCIWPEEIQKVIDTIKNNCAMDLQERLLPSITNIAIFLAIAIPLVIIHELIHGLFYSIYAKNGFKSLKFGFIPKKQVAYCDCTEVLRIDHFRIGLIMPLILMGLIPTIIALLIGKFLLLLWGILFIAAASVDILGCLKLSKEKNDSWIIFRTPEMAGAIYRPRK
jgi:uncharacterized membrane protein